MRPMTAGSRLVTVTAGSPQSATLSASTPARAFITSLEISVKASPQASLSEAAMSVVLPPGAAQRSNTLSPGFISSLPTGAMALGS